MNMEGVGKFVLDNVIAAEDEGRSKSDWFSDLQWVSIFAKIV